MENWTDIAFGDELRRLPLAAAALQKALFLGQNLVVNEARMKQNIAASQGLMLAEAVTFSFDDATNLTVIMGLGKGIFNVHLLQQPPDR